jgi:hypothetical protein
MPMEDSPHMALFIRLTIMVALGIVALVALLFLLKTLFVAALIAAVVVGVAFAVNFFRRRLGKGDIQLISRGRY